MPDVGLACVSGAFATPRVPAAARSGKDHWWPLRICIPDKLRQGLQLMLLNVQTFGKAVVDI